MLGFSNIGAFEVNAETRKRVDSLFSALTVSWGYLLEEEEIKQYINIVGKNYSEKHTEWLKNVIHLQEYTFIKKKINSHYWLGHALLKMKWERQKRVFLYGGGYWAKLYMRYAKINHLPICGQVISDDQDMIVESEVSLPVYWLKDLPYGPEECSFVLALDSRHFAQVTKNLMNKGYYMIL